MLRNSYNRFFPTPQFLSPPSYGLDISDESLKYVELIGTRHGLQVKRYGERKIPPGIIESGKIKEQKKLEEILADLREKEGIRSVRVSLPEEQIYLFKLRLPKEGLTSIEDGIELSLEEHVPLSAEDTVFDYDVISEDAVSVEVEVAAAPRTIIESYLTLFEHSGVMVPSFELEAQAVARVMVKKGDQETYMLVDFGEKRTGISIVSRGTVMFASTIDAGGVMLTNMLAKNFKLSFEEAERMKRKYGLQRNAENKEMFSVLLNGVSILRDEISKHFLYWHTHEDEEGKMRPPIKKIILSGGNANLAGLTEYFSVSMKNQVEMANVWINIMDIEKQVPGIDFAESLSYATALGLALGDFD